MNHNFVSAHLVYTARVQCLAASANAYSAATVLPALVWAATNTERPCAGTEGITPTVAGISRLQYLGAQPADRRQASAGRQAQGAAMGNRPAVGNQPPGEQLLH